MDTIKAEIYFRYPTQTFMPLTTMASLALSAGEPCRGVMNIPALSRFRVGTNENEVDITHHLQSARVSNDIQTIYRDRCQRLAGD